MKRRLLIALLAVVCILPALALTASPGEQIQANYSENATAESTTFYTDLPAQLTASNTNTTHILSEELSTVYATSTYFLTAKDDNGQIASHDVFVTVTPSIQITPALGISDTESLNVSINSEETCQYRAHPFDQAYAQEWQTIPESNNLTNFQNVYGLDDGEEVYVDIKCGSTIETFLFGIDTTEFSDVTPRMSPATPSLEAPVTIYLNTDKRTNCNLTTPSGTMYQSVLLKEHTFPYLEDTGRYNYSCTDGHKTMKGDYFRSSNIEAEFDAYLSSPKTITQEDYVAVVETTLPAECTYQEEVIGSLRSNTQHQVPIQNIVPGVNEFTITCTQNDNEEEVQEVRESVTLETSDVLETLSATLSACSDDVQITNIAGNDQHIGVVRGSYDIVTRSQSLRANKLANAGETVTLITVHKHNPSILKSASGFEVEEKSLIECRNDKQTITLVNPAPPTNSSSEEFTYEVRTEYESTCTVSSSNVQDVEMSTQGGYEHALAQAADTLELSKFQTHELEVTCTDTTTQVSTNTHTIHYGFSEPTITLTASNVTNPVTREASITLAVDQPAECEYAGNQYTPVENQGTYVRTFSVSLAADETSKEVEVTCINDRSLDSTESITVYEDFAELDRDEPHTLSFELIEPSPLGVSSQQYFDVAVNAGEQTCTWNFYTPDSLAANSAQEMENNRIQNFSQTYPIPEAGYIFLEITCGEETELVPVGHKTPDTDQGTLILEQVGIWPNSYIASDDKFAFISTDQAPVQCTSPFDKTTTPWTTQFYQYPKTHVLFDTNQESIGSVTIECVDAYGRPQTLVRTRSEYTEAPLEVYAKPAKNTTEQYQDLIAFTNKPAACEFNSQEMQATKEGTVHIGQVSLAPEEKDNIFVECEDALGNQEDYSLSYQRYTQPITFSNQAAYRCLDQTVITANSEAQYVGVQYGEQEILYHVGEITGDIRLEVPFGEVGETLQVRTFNNAGVSSEQQPVTVQTPETSSQCAYPNPQTISLSQPTQGELTTENNEIIISTQLPSTCAVNSETISQELTKTHTITAQELNLVQAQENTLEVTCQDPIGQPSEETFSVFYEMPQPEITVSANPQNIQYYGQETSTLTIESNTPVRCKLSGEEGYRNAPYQETVTTDVVISDETSQTFEVTCENPALDQDSASVTLTNDFLEIPEHQSRELPFTILQPSSLGVSNTQDFSVEIDSQEQCEWRFSNPINENEYQEMTANTISDFSQTYPLSDGSYHYLDIRCGEDEALVPIGFVSEYQQIQTLDVLPHTYSTRQEEYGMYMHDQHPTRCETPLGTTTPWTDAIHTYPATHLLYGAGPVQEADTHEIEVSCINAHGVAEPTTRTRAKVSTPEQQIHIIQPTPSTQENQELTVITRLPSACRVGSTYLKSTRDGRLHQAVIQVSQETDTKTVSCESLAGPDSEPVTFTRSLQAPQTPSGITATYCVDRTYLSTESTHPYIAVSFTQQGEIVVFDNTQELITLPYGAQGEEIRVYAIDQAGRASSASVPITIAEASSDCGFDQPQDITLTQPESTIAQASDSTIELATQYLSTCTVNGVAISTEPTYTHSTTPEEIGLTSNQYNDLSITCTDVTDQLTTNNDIEIYYGVQEPIIESLTADPDEMISFGSVESEVAITANTAVKCREEQQGVYTPNYDTEHTITVTVPSGGKTFEFTCKNRLEEHSEPKTISIQANYADPLQLSANDLPFTLLEPSLLGVSNTQDFSVAVQPAQEETCEWRFHNPHQENTYQPMGDSNRIDDFSQTYPIADGYYHYLDIRCGEDEALVPIGLNTGTTQEVRSPDMSVWPQTYTQATASYGVQAQSPAPVRCTTPHGEITPWTQEFSEYPRNYLSFGQGQESEQGNYPVPVTCINAYGQEIQNNALYRYIDSESLELYVPEVPASTAGTRQVVAYTSIPATCVVNGEVMQITEQAQTHLKEISVSAPQTNAFVSCSREGFSTASQTITIQRPITVEEIDESGTRAFVCYDHVYAEVDTQAPFVAVQGPDGSQEIIYAQTGNRIAIPFGQPGQTLRFRPLNQAGESSAGFVTKTIQEEVSPNQCGYPQDQTITIESPQNHALSEQNNVLRLASQVPSECSVGGTQISTEYSTSHETTAQEIGLEQGVNTIVAACQDPAGSVSTQEFTLYYNIPEPEITSANLDPEVLTSYDQSTSQVTITANTPVRCREAEKGFSGVELQEEYVLEIFAGRGGKTTELVCENVLEQQTAPYEITIGTDYPAVNVVEQTAVEVEESSVSVQSTSMIPSECQVSLITEPGASILRQAEMSTGDDLTHSFTFTEVEQGIYGVQTTCTADSEDTQSDIHRPIAVGEDDIEFGINTQLPENNESLSPFTLEVTTTHPAECSARNQATTADMNTEAGYTHRLAQANEKIAITRNTEPTVRVSCTSMLTRQTQTKEIDISYGFATPQVSLAIQEVTNPLTLVAAIQFAADQEVTCSATPGSAEVTNSKRGTLRVVATQDGQTFTVRCENKKGRYFEEQITAIHNFAEQEQILDTALSFDIIEPSPHAISTSTNFDFVIETDLAACKWRFYSPYEDTNNYQLFEELEDNQYQIASFAANYPLAEDTYHYIEVSCGDKQPTLIPIGFFPDADTYEVNKPAVHANNYVTSDEEFLVVTQETLPTTCEFLDWTLTPWTSNPLDYPKQHAVTGFESATNFDIACTRPATNTAKGFTAIRYADESAEENLEILAEPTRPTRNQAHELRVFTTRTASCDVSYQDQEARMSSTQNGRVHYQTLNRPAGTTTARVTCQSAQDETTKTITLTRDLTVPTVGEIDAYVCRGNAVVHAQSEDARLLTIKDATKTLTYDYRESEMYEHPDVIEGDQLTIRAISQAGVESGAQTVTAQLPESPSDCSYEQVIELTQPTDQQIPSEDMDFTFEVRTTAPSTCQLNEENMTRGLTYDTVHELSSTNVILQPGRINDIRVKCTDLYGENKTNVFELYYVLPQPSIESLTADPAVVTSYQNRESTISIQANTHVQCYKQGEEEQTRNQAYDTQQTLTHVVERDVANNVSITCENPHGVQVNDSIFINENLPTTLDIVDTEANASGRTITVSTVTSVPSTCIAELYLQPDLDNFIRAQDMISPGGVVHEYAFTNLDEGVYSYKTICEELPPPCPEDADFCPQSCNPDLELCEENSTKQGPPQPPRVVIDLTTPEIIPTSNQLTCGLGSYTYNAEVTDNIEDNIQEVIVEFQETNYTGNKFPLTVHNLELTHEQTYDVRAWAVDSQGNVGGPATLEIQAQNASSAACDVEKPRAQLLRYNKTPEGDYYQLLCEDNQGCAGYSTSVVAENEECNLNSNNEFSSQETRTEPFIVSGTSRVCYEVRDHAGNKLQDVEVITVGAYVPPEENENVSEEPVDQTDQNLCSNGVQDPSESDVDCGGLICGACEESQACDYNSDCLSGSCIQGICVEATCSDSRQNGDETGIDCGGSCDTACRNGNSCVVDSDCESGICTDAGTCADQELQSDNYESETNEPQEEQPNTFDDQNESNALAFTFLIAGLLMSLSGGGYWMYQQQHASQQLTTPRNDVLEQGQQQYAPGQVQQRQAPKRPTQESQLRTQARQEKQEKRKSKRKDLLDSFDEE